MCKIGSEGQSHCVLGPTDNDLAVDSLAEGITGLKTVNTAGLGCSALDKPACKNGPRGHLGI